MWIDLDNETMPGLVEDFGKLVNERGKTSNRLRIGRTCQSCAHFDVTCNRGEPRPTSPDVRCLSWTLTLDRQRLPELEQGTDHFRLNANLQMARKLYPEAKHQETGLIVGMSCRSCRSCRGGVCKNEQGPRPNVKVPTHAVCKFWKLENAAGKLGKLKKELEVLGANVKGTMWKKGAANRPKQKASEERFQKAWDEYEAEQNTPEAIAEALAEKEQNAVERKARRERIKADMAAGKKWKKRGLGLSELIEMHEIEVQVDLGMTDEELDACREAANAFEMDGVCHFAGCYGLSSDYRREANQETYFDPKSWLDSYREGMAVKATEEAGPSRAILRKKARVE
jgi:hypothetical protein